MPATDFPAEELTRSVIGAFFTVYNELGYGFLEHTYVRALEWELHGRGHRAAREVAVPVFYQGVELSVHRLDLVVDERLVVEVKSAEYLPPSARRQLLNYLKSTRLEVGLLLHFGPVPRFQRIVASNSIRVHGLSRRAGHSH